MFLHLLVLFQDSNIAEPLAQFDRLLLPIDLGYLIDL